MKPRILGVVMLVGLSSFVAQSTAVAQSEPATAVAKSDRTVSNAGDTAPLEEIVVTARKREESLQHVPLSVVALSGDQLEQRSIADLGDLGQNTPNLTFSQTLNGGALAGVAFIRGVGQRDAQPAYDPGVGVYVDGVYMGRMYANDLDLLEIERVEVLRGPQGTLFGKNTSGGAISIVTRQPDTSAWSGRAQVTTGSRDRLDALAGINVPLSERAALQLAALRSRQDGYGRRLDGQEMANTDRSIARGQLLLRPSDAFSALLAADWTEFDERNASFKLVDVNTSVVPVAVLNALTDPDYDERWISQSDYFFNGTGPNSARGEVWGGSLTLAYDAGWASLKSITAYREMDVHSDLDPDGAPIIVINKFEHAAQDQFSQELQAAGNAAAGRLDWVVGAYYFHEEIADTDRFDLLAPVFGDAADFSRDIPVENDSVAAYAQGSYRFGDRLRLTAGLRFTDDEKKVRTTQYDFTGSVIFSTPLGVHSSDAWSPRLGLDYQWTPDVMTYVSVANGAKNGGFNGRAGRPSDFTEFDDEEVWTYELGLRSDLLGGRARFNATAFYSDYRDLQLQISGSTTVNNAPAPFSLITNIPKARITGGEAELTFAPLQGLTLSGNLGLAYAEYTELPTDPQFVAAGIIDEDSEFSHTPEVSYALGAEYSASVTDSLGMTARVDYTHRSRVYYLPENTDASLQPAYGLLNARLTFEHAPSGVSVSLFGTNLTDETYIIAAFDDARNPNPGLGFATVNQGRPREWGLSAQVRF